MSEETAQDHSAQYSLDYARKEGLRVVLPRKGQLLIDIDTDADFAVFEQNLPLIKPLYPYTGHIVTPSRSKPEGRHITVHLNVSLTPMERIALQAVLGSDRRREAYSIERLKNDDVTPTIFFEKADAAR